MNSCTTPPPSSHTHTHTNTQLYSELHQAQTIWKRALKLQEGKGDSRSNSKFSCHVLSSNTLFLQKLFLEKHLVSYVGPVYVFVCLFVFCCPIICASLSGIAPVPLVPAPLTPATPRVYSALQPRPQRSTRGDVRLLVGCLSKGDTALLWSHFGGLPQ